jgi:excisionase family DNA binding protein
VETLGIMTPEELAKQMGWSARRVRKLARELGACRILGNRMRLTRDDVDAILEETRPRPLGPSVRLKDIVRRGPTDLPNVTSAELLAMLERDKKPRQRRARSPRFKPHTKPDGS